MIELPKSKYFFAFIVLFCFPGTYCIDQTDFEHIEIYLPPSLVLNLMECTTTSSFSAPFSIKYVPWAQNSRFAVTLSKMVSLHSSVIDQDKLRLTENPCFSLPSD